MLTIVNGAGLPHDRVVLDGLGYLNWNDLRANGYDEASVEVSASACSVPSPLPCPARRLL